MKKTKVINDTGKTTQKDKKTRQKTLFSYDKTKTFFPSEHRYFFQEKVILLSFFFFFLQKKRSSAM